MARLTVRQVLRLLQLVPKLLWEAVMHLALRRNRHLGWSVRVHVTVAAIRALMAIPGFTIEQIQAAGRLPQVARAPGVTVSPPLRVPAPTAARARVVEGAVDAAVTALTEPDPPMPTVHAAATSVEAEWIVPAGKGPTVQPTDVVIVYVHGGGHYTGSRAGYRPLTVRLAEATGARVLSVDYRLAPQSAFPAALVDVLVAYEWVLRSVPASQVILAGDSAGGNLVLAAVGVALNAPGVPMPAGVVALSPWCDLVRAQPSEASAEADRFDYLPPADFYPPVEPSSAWPKPDRTWFYCPDEAMLHPLVSPVLLRSWAGACPLYVATGDERFKDAIVLTAERYRAGGSPTVLRHHERLPHVFHVLGPSLPSVARSFAEIAAFVRAAVARAAGEKASFAAPAATVALDGAERPGVAGADAAAAAAATSVDSLRAHMLAYGLRWRAQLQGAA
ncbi:Alpha/Beta hydrolase protein, partial [Dipodascopsis tothii]|uniref:Alpha/Beta hydrolase protein n=1 Tax=Dipodascopsis tothii TaxID=44089 RepID=UPI0034CDBDB1